MQQSAEFAATLLEASAPGFAGMASSLLLERHPEFKAVWGEDASSRWKKHLQQRLLELAAAIRAAEPALFVSRVQWTARAFIAREAPLESVVQGLGCLRDILAERLPEPGRDIALSYLDQGAKGVGLAATAESSALRRFRPIMLTSLTTFIGLAPMIFETSVQARFLVPMAISLGYGILLSTAVVLLFTPAVHRIAQDVHAVGRRTLDVIRREPLSQSSS